MKLRRSRILGSIALLFGGCAAPPAADPASPAPSPASATAEPSQPSSSGRGYASVRLGIRPSMDEDVDGVGVQSVSAGTSADRGGVLAGDVIIAWGGDDLIDVMDMVLHLRSHKPGDEVTLIVLRDGEEVALNIVLQGNEDVRQD